MLAWWSASTLHVSPATIATGNVLALKGNQGSLRDDVELFAAEQKAKAFADTKISQYETVDGDHGRIETRTYTAFHDVGWLQQRHDWPGLQGVVMVESTREVGDKVERETRFYLTSLVWLAHQLGPAIRSHWAVENSLHWALDMIFRDDDCRVRTNHGPANFTLIKHVALNLIRRAPGGTACALNAKSQHGTTISWQASSPHEFSSDSPGCRGLAGATLSPASAGARREPATDLACYQHVGSRSQAHSTLRRPRGRARPEAHSRAGLNEDHMADGSDERALPAAARA